MRAIGTAVLFFTVATNCFGAGDPVSSSTKDKRTEKTTFQRDNKTILIIAAYRSTDPEKRLLRQSVMFKGKVAVDITEFQGNRTFIVHAKPHVSVIIGQNQSAGALETLILMDDDSGDIIEAFKVKDSRLSPLSGKELERQRGITKDVSGLLDPKSVRKTTPEEFGKRVKEMEKKYNPKESDSQGGEHSDDKPAS